MSGNTPELTATTISQLCDIAHCAFHVLDDADRDAIRGASDASRVDDLEKALDVFCGVDTDDPHVKIAAIRALKRPVGVGGDACGWCHGKGITAMATDLLARDPAEQRMIHEYAEDHPVTCPNCGGTGKSPVAEATPSPADTGLLELVASFSAIIQKFNEPDVYRDSDVILTHGKHELTIGHIRQAATALLAVTAERDDYIGKRDLVRHALTAAQQRLGEMRDALRECVIHQPTKELNLGCCNLCGAAWAKDLPEHHDPNCLAAPPAKDGDVG